MHIRNWMALVHDVAAAVIAWYLAYWLRFNTEIPPANLNNMLAAMLWVVPLQALIFFGSGMYRGMWRYASVPDLQRIAAAVVVSTLAIALILVMLPPQQPPVPRSVILLDPILLIMLLGGSRLAYRVWKERRLRSVLSAYRPEIMFHAAAYKHVPLMEEGNAWEAIQNNVLGTCRVAEAAIAQGVEKCVLVSTAPEAASAIAVSAARIGAFGASTPK